MPEIKVQIKNLAEIKSAFRKAPADMVRELNKAIAKSVFSIQRGEIKEYQALGIRIITKGLYNSITRGTYFSNLKGEVGPNVTNSAGVNYAVYVHEGTRYMRARPFLYNSVNASQKDVDKFFTEAVENVLNNIEKST